MRKLDTFVLMVAALGFLLLALTGPAEATAYVEGLVPEWVGV